jgi:hypothetical protein
VGRHELQQVRSRAARVAARGRVLCYASPSTRIVSVVPCSRCLQRCMSLVASRCRQLACGRETWSLPTRTGRSAARSRPSARSSPVAGVGNAPTYTSFQRRASPMRRRRYAQAPLCTGSWNLCPSPRYTTSWVLTLNVLSAFQYSRDCDTGDSSSPAPTTMSVGVRTFFTKLIGELLTEGGCFYELHPDHTKAPPVIARAGNRFWNHAKLL